MTYLGDMTLGSTIFFKFTTVGTSGVPTQLAATTSTTISVYPDNSTTQITAGATLTTDFDGITGLNAVSIALTGGNGFAVATDYSVVLATGTVGGTNVLGYVVGDFSVQKRNFILPAGIINSATFSAGAITSTTFTTGAIAATTFIAGAITSTVLAAGAIHSTIFTTGSIAATTFVAGAITSTVLANNAIGSSNLAADATADIADALLNRDMSTGTDSGSTTVRTPRQALRFLRNKWTIATTSLTVYKEDDATSSWSATVSTDATAVPIVGNDPAGP